MILNLKSGGESPSSSSRDVNEVIEEQGPAPRQPLEPRFVTGVLVFILIVQSSLNLTASLHSLQYLATLN